MIKNRTVYSLKVYPNKTLTNYKRKGEWRSLTYNMLTEYQSEYY